MTVLTAALLGVMTGLHTATWGAYKDSPFEGFKWPSFLRSVLLGCGIAVAIALTTTWTDDLHPLVLVGLVYTGERLVTEWWKTIVREDDQSAYTIPMRLGYRGRPVDNHLIRYAVGAAIVLGLVLACVAATALQSVLPPEPGWATILIGGVGGWLTAVGGAWKDAPIEGFSPWKFMRSPVVATAWAVPLSFLTDQWALLAFAAGGFSVASIETYKTFFTGGRPPGKFATKTVAHRFPRLRPALAVQHTACWVALAVVVSISATQAAASTGSTEASTEASSGAAPSYDCVSLRYARLENAISTTTSMTELATTNVSAMPRAWPSPSSQPKVERPVSVLMNGMSRNCASGPTTNAATGVEADSMLCANPNTRPCFSNGTSR
jgi:hypothetical protein